MVQNQPIKTKQSIKIGDKFIVNNVYYATNCGRYLYVSSISTAYDGSIEVSLKLHIPNVEPDRDIYVVSFDWLLHNINKKQYIKVITLEL